MNDVVLLPNNQFRLAIHALLGDAASQRLVLDLTVRLAAAGIEPIDLFKRSAMVSLKSALDSGKLPSAPDKRRRGDSGNEFKIAVAYEKAVLMSDPSPATTVAHELMPDTFSNNKKNPFPAINRARKRHGDLSGRPNLAKERALFELAQGDESGPNLDWMADWNVYCGELQFEIDAAVCRLLSGYAEDIRKQSNK